MPTQRAQFRQPAVLDLDQTRGGNTGAMQERTVLEGAGLFDTNVQPERGVGDEDPGVLLDGAAEQFVENCGGGNVFYFLDALCFVEFRGGVFVCAGVGFVGGV